MPTKRPAQRPYQRHGLHTLERRLEIGDIDSSSPLAVALESWRADLIRDLGGEDAVSTQQRALVDLAARTWLLVGSVDDFILRMPSVINRQKHRLHPVVVQRQSLVTQLQSLLRDLGLQRKARQLEPEAILAHFKKPGSDA